MGFTLVQHLHTDRCGEKMYWERNFVAESLIQVEVVTYGQENEEEAEQFREKRLCRVCEKL